MNKLQWIAGSVVCTVLIITFGASLSGCSDKASDNLEVGNYAALSFPDQGTMVLTKCADTSCVAAKASELAAQAEAETQRLREAQAAAQQATVEASCEEQLANWAAMYGNLPSYQRPPMPCGPYAGYSSSWTAEQARWEAMTPEQKEAEAIRNGGTYRAP